MSDRLAAAEEELTKASANAKAALEARHRAEDALRTAVMADEDAYNKWKLARSRWLTIRDDEGIEP